MQKTAYEMRISYWSSDVCSSDLIGTLGAVIEPLVMIVDRHREHALGLLLPDHIIVEHVADFLRRGNAAVFLRDQRRLRFLADAVVAQFDAFIADEQRRSGEDRKSPRLNSSHYCASRLPSSA